MRVALGRTITAPSDFNITIFHSLRLLKHAQITLRESSNAYLGLPKTCGLEAFIKASQAF